MLKRDVLKNSAILIVDDVPKTRQYLGSLFREAGFPNVRMVEDGNKALDIIAIWVPDIILMDLTRNKVEGYQCLS